MQFYKVKKGFTLIEAVAASAIFCIFTVFVISILFNFVKSYKEDMKVNNDEASFTSGLIIISKFLKEGTVNIEKDNEIKVVKDENDFNIIRLNSYTGKIVVDYYELNEKVTSNNIIEKVSSFNILQNKNVFYLYITLNDGRRIRKCFPIKE
ncbi:type II secretion system GspH family protein [Clostridium felsineum]|uniref:type II secretion system protein n=1 Tax=Clostridium felsineum TaxID=36839 RepID=UPI00214DE4FC|nr:type II secretion system protein [Clostridium felsineum]MCR3760237.1 type II secretion system GspH family protein [Clostridium felsineum]